MVKKDNSFVDDIALVKEIEELKLKQQLLISSLKKKAQTQESQLFLDVNSKLDFLVKIFKESISPHEEGENIEGEEEETIETKVDKLIEKIDILNSNFNEKIEKIEKKIGSASITSKINKPNKSEELSQDDSSKEILADVKKEVIIDNKVKDVSKVDIENPKDESERLVKPEDAKLPPKPDFESKIEETKATIVENKKEKKKKWF